MVPTPAETFVAAITSHDRRALTGTLTPEVDFRGMTPRRFWEASTPDEVAEVVLGSWFEDDDRIDEVTSLEHGEDVGDVHRVAYRFHITNPGGRWVVEQQAYYRLDGDRIRYLRVACSGFRPRH